MNDGKHFVTLSPSAIAIATFGLGYIGGQYQQRVTDLVHSIVRLYTKRETENSPNTTLSGWQRLVRPNILHLTPYRCARDDYDKGILLDANENSLGPSLRDETIDAYKLETLERYPCPHQIDLKKAIAKFRNRDCPHAVQPENIFLGVGSDEAIDLLIRVTCTPGVDEILITPPTYGMYSVCANINDAKILSVPLDPIVPASNPNGLNDETYMPCFHINVEKILKTVSDRTKLLFLCSPGNPTANSLRTCDVEVILNAPEYRGLVVIDEAYIDFSSNSSMCTLVNQYDRLVVLQTFSKSFGLAGIRVGCAFGNPQFIQVLNNVKAPYNINKLSAKIALEAIQYPANLNEKIKLIREEKQRVICELRKRPFVKTIFQSDSNFVLFRVPFAHEIYKKMADDKLVVIRYRGSHPILYDCLRATIGSVDENNSMLEALTDAFQKIMQAQ